MCESIFHSYPFLVRSFPEWFVFTVIVNGIFKIKTLITSYFHIESYNFLIGFVIPTVLNFLIFL